MRAFIQIRFKAIKKYIYSEYKPNFEKGSKKVYNFIGSRLINCIQLMSFLNEISHTHTLK